MQPTSAISPKKGRSAELISLRNIALVKRFYHLYEVKRMRYDDVIEHLMLKEFFIEEDTILTIIRKNQSLLDSMYEEAKERIISDR